MIDLWVVLVVAFGVIGSIITVVYRRTVNNSRRLSILEVSLGKLEEIPHVIEKHEQREDRQFQRITSTLEKMNKELVKIAIDVAVIKKNGSAFKV